MRNPSSPVVVCVVGGGSTYTPELVDGLLRRREALALREIRLVDIDRGRLEVLGPMARRMCEKAGAETGESPVGVSWGTELAEGVRGADFVVSQIRVGGMEARHRDELLGREFGLIGQETVGVGGFANALRTIPVALEIAATVAREAPDAILLNFTNPAGLVTEALCRHTGVPTIGLCNVPWGVKSGVAHGLGVPFDAIELDYVGLNHLSWVRGFRVDGVDVTDRVLGDLRSELGKRTRRDTEPDWDDETIAFLHAMPNYYLLYYYETAAMLAHQAATPTRAAEVMELEAGLLDQYRDVHLDSKPAELEQRGGAYYSETAAALMADLWTGAGTVHVVDVPNQGAIPGLPDDVVVEVAARVDRDGAHPIPVAPMRPDIDALVHTMKDFELLTVDAAVHGDEQAALLALVTNPLGPPAHSARAVWNRLREVHSGMLGRLDP